MRKIELKHVGFLYDPKWDYLMITTPLNPKGQPRDLKRFVRIKRNVIRELKALDKEIARHKP